MARHKTEEEKNRRRRT